MTSRKPISAEEAALLAFAESIVVQRVIYGCASSLSLMISILAAEAEHGIAAIVGFFVTAVLVILYALTRWKLRKMYKDITLPMKMAAAQQN